MINIQETIKILCIKRNTSVTRIAEKMGKTKQNLYNKMHRNDMKLSELEKILNMLDYEMKIVIVDKNTKENVM